MRKLLIRFLRWLLSLLEPPQPPTIPAAEPASVRVTAKVSDAPPRPASPSIPEEVMLLIPPAKEFAARFRGSSMSGEAKRHQVYALMLKAYPQANHRHIGLAIEMAVLDA